MLSRELERLLSKVQKPARYTGGELNCVIKDKNSVDIRFALCFPDTYEIGMSHLGIKILYGMLNAREDVWCERVFAPWTDMENEMREHDIKLFALESCEPIDTFDFVGFTLQYEMSYSNILNMLELAGIPLLAKDRGEDSPLIIAGGPCAYNCEPLADFLDLVVLGEGEAVLGDIIDIYKRCKAEGKTKNQFLEYAASLNGVYIPSFYDVEYNSDGTVCSIEPNCAQAPKSVQKVIVKDLNSAYYPEDFVVPGIETVHDRVMLEIFRGCIRGCRFCQAGMVYRPVREKSVDLLVSQALSLQTKTGYDEISLSSLSTSDYSDLEKLLDKLLDWTQDRKVNLALPSLRIDNFSSGLIQKIQKVRKSGLTFAPEAGTQRLRDAINKNITEEEIIETARTAFNNANSSVKLYFMIGLPTETQDDLKGIVDLGFKIVNTYNSCEKRNKMHSVTVTISLASFVPKPFTPFQWEAQDTMEMLSEKQRYFKETVKSRKITLNWHDVNTSFMEAVFARGDRRLSAVLIEAHKRGCKFDAWDDEFKYDEWIASFEKCGLDPAFYANRKRSFDEVLPWDHIDIGVSKKYLIDECKKAYLSETTENCRQKCNACGANKLTGGVCQ